MNYAPLIFFDRYLSISSHYSLKIQQNYLLFVHKNKKVTINHLIWMKHSAAPPPHEMDGPPRKRGTPRRVATTAAALSQVNATPRQQKNKQPRQEGITGRAFGQTAERSAALAQRQDRRDGDGRRKDPRGDAPRIPQRPRKKGVHLVTVTTIWPSATRVDGPDTSSTVCRQARIDDTQPNPTPGARHSMADITFGTNNEYGFDRPARQHGFVVRRPRTEHHSPSSMRWTPY